MMMIGDYGIRVFLLVALLVKKEVSDFSVGTDKGNNKTIITPVGKKFAASNVHTLYVDLLRSLWSVGWFFFWVFFF